MPAPPLALHPRSCDRCGRCIPACPRGAVRVGRAYLAIEWSRCDGCGACARACDRRAIVLRGSPRGHGVGSGRGTAVSPQDLRSTGPIPRARSVKPADTPGWATPLRGGSRGGFQWTLLEAAAMLSVTFSVFIVKELIMASAALDGLPAGSAVAARAGVLGLYYGVQVAVLAWLVKRRGGAPRAAVGLEPPGEGIAGIARSAVLVLAGLVLTRSVASVYAYATGALGLMPDATVDLPGLFGADAMGLVLAIGMLVVVGPLVEEVVFRAALLEGLAARFGTWPGVIAQAALFAAFHRSVWLLFPTFVLGIVLGWLVSRRGSLVPAIALHALYNTITVASAFYIAGRG